MEPLFIFLCIGIIAIGSSIRPIINKCKASHNIDNNENEELTNNSTNNIVVDDEIPPKYEEIYN